MANDLRNTEGNPLEDFFGDFGKSFLNSVAGSNSMRSDVIDNPDAYVVKIDLPGFKKSDIKINYDDDTLEVKAIKDLSKGDKDDDGRVLRHERNSSSQSRSFYIPDVVADGISAEYNGGVLKITLPKAKDENSDAHHIDIN